jgi:hypothetical protein
MNPHSNNDGARNAEALYRQCWLSPQIPHDIIDQEAEIELMIRHFPECINHLQEQSESTQRQRITVWIFIVLTGLVSLLSVYILYVK